MTDFYTIHAKAYHQRTFHIDPTSFLTPFCRHIPLNARVLDIGCGSGRDMAWLKARGYRVMGLDRSPELATIAAYETGCPVVVGDFACFDFSRFRMEGLLLVAALVHVPPDQFLDTLRNIIKALKPGGHLLITLKEGQGWVKTDGRRFYHWHQTELEKILSQCGSYPVETFRQRSLLQKEDIWLSYVMKYENSD
jgi:SAM-dependent methyltransferase